MEIIVGYLVIMFAIWGANGWKNPGKFFAYLFGIPLGLAAIAFILLWIMCSGGGHRW